MTIKMIKKFNELGIPTSHIAGELQTSRQNLYYALKKNHKRRKLVARLQRIAFDKAIQLLMMSQEHYLENYEIDSSNILEYLAHQNQRKWEDENF